VLFVESYGASVYSVTRHINAHRSYGTLIHLFVKELKVTNILGTDCRQGIVMLLVYDKRERDVPNGKR